MWAPFGSRRGEMPAARHCRADSRMEPSSLSNRIASLPKTELHLHLEGSIQPATVCALTARHGFITTEEEVRQRYAYRDFPEFIEAFKWVTSFLREPQDYALIARDLAEHLLKQGVIYTEVTLSIGVMLLRKQRPEANFEALLCATEPFERRGLRFRWVFAAARHFGVDAAIEVVELLGAERIGHGIAAINDPELMDFLAERKIPLEICPASNMKTAALALQLGLKEPTIEDHPLPKLFRHGIPIVLSTDDPAMFHTTLREEYAHAARMGLREDELARIVEMGFQHAFLPDVAKHSG